MDIIMTFCRMKNIQGIVWNPNNPAYKSVNIHYQHEHRSSIKCTRMLINSYFNLQKKHKIVYVNNNHYLNIRIYKYRHSSSQTDCKIKPMHVPNVCFNHCIKACCITNVWYEARVCSQMYLSTCPTTSFFNRHNVCMNQDIG